MTPERQPVPSPLKTNDVVVSAIGAAAFAVALVVLLIVPLDPADRWWRWVCAVGCVMGLFGVWYVPRLQRRRTAAAERHAAAKDDPAD